MTPSFPTRRSSDLLVTAAHHRQDYHLLRRDRGWHAQSVVIAMRHDDAADQPRRYAPAGRVAELLRTFTVLELYSSRLGEIGAEVMRRSEEHTSELQSLMRISYAVFCLKKKK